MNMFFNQQPTNKRKNNPEKITPISFNLGNFHRDKIISCFSILFLLLSAIIQAQTTKEEFFSDPTFASGIYKPYSFTNTVATPEPKGYKPFYISHYGRHGSRWLTSAHYYENPNEILQEAHEANKLTAFGESVYYRVKLLAEDAEGRYGALSQLGAIEHKGIARRMFRSFPEVFSTKKGRKCFIYSRSTEVPRCILSMTANNEQLKELNPEIDIFREAVDKNAYLNNGNPNRKTCKDSISAIYHNFFNEHFDTEHFLSSLFTDPGYVQKHIEDSYNFIYEMYSLVADVPDMDHLNISMSDIFSKDELFILWQTSNLRMYYNCGPSVINGKAATNSAKLLLKDILDCAENAIEKGNTSADLRFGHDVYIMPLLALMDIQDMNVQEPDPEKVYLRWSDFKVSPMGVNLQLIFYQNKKKDDILVKFLHCEKEVKIPVATDMAPYYHWKDVKAYYTQKLAVSHASILKTPAAKYQARDRAIKICEELITRDKNSVIVVDNGEAGIIPHAFTGGYVSSRNGTCQFEYCSR